MVVSNLPPHPELNISAFERMLEMKSFTNSYKLYWFASLFDLILQGADEVSFQDVVVGMICKCWYTLLEYRLNLGKLDQLPKIVNLIATKNGFDKTSSEIYIKSEIVKLLDTEFTFSYDQNIGRLFRSFFDYVPYRLLSPFYHQKLKDNRISENSKNKNIAEYSQKENSSLYKIYPEKEIIIISPLWKEYIVQNQPIIKGWLYYKLIYFLQVRNPSIPAIPFKLHPPVQRNLTAATKFFKDVLQNENMNDIYTAAPLDCNLFSIDHFIPWSFVLHDRLWNLVPTAKSVNSSKSDSLPAEIYLDGFCDFQYKCYSASLRRNIDKRLIEDYIDIGGADDIIKTILPEEIFINRLKNQIMPLFQLAANSGFKTGFYYNEPLSILPKAADEHNPFNR